MSRKRLAPLIAGILLIAVACLSFVAFLRGRFRGPALAPSPSARAAIPSQERSATKARRAPAALTHRLRSERRVGDRAKAEEGARPCCPDSQRARESLSEALDENTLPEILRAFGLPGDIELREEDRERIWEILKNFREVFRSAKEEEERTKEEIVQRKLSEGDYYMHAAWLEIKDDARLRDAFLSFRTRDGEDVVVALWPDDYAPLLKISDRRREERKKAIAEIEKILEPYGPTGESRDSARDAAARLSPSLLNNPQFLGGLFEDLGLPKLAQISEEKRAEVIAIVREYRTYRDGLRLQRKAIVDEVIERKRREGSYYDPESFRKVMNDPRVVEGHHQVAGRDVDGKHVYVTVTQRDDPRLAELEKEERALFIDTIVAIQSLFAPGSGPASASSGPPDPEAAAPFDGDGKGEKISEGEP